MSETYEPGTVATSRYGRVFYTSKRGGGWLFDDGSGPAQNPGDLRPLVVLDLDLAAHIGVDRLVADLRTGGFYDLADQIEAQTRPPKPEVYEHLVVRQVATAAESACGKQWTPGEDVTVVGRCPECQDIAEGGWTA